MAAKSKGRLIAGGCFGKRFANQVWGSSSRDPSLPSAFPASASRRGAHVSSYDKNVDEQVRPSVVPDDVIEAQSDKYWGPHPKTGVFGPADPGAEPASDSTGHVAGNGSSVLDQKAWFRPLEDVDEPPHA